MSANNEYDENSGGSLRDYADSQKKRADKLQKDFEALQSQLNEQSRSALYEKKGITPTLRRWMEKDSVEPTEAAFDKWLSENGSDFGYQAPGAQEGSEGATAQEAPAQAAPAAQSVLTPELQQALAQFQEIFGGQTGQALIPSDQAKAAVDQVAANINLGHESHRTQYEDVVRQLADAGIPIESDLKF